MQICIQTEPSERAADYATLARFAKAVEELGFHGLFRSDHFLRFGARTGPSAPSDAWTSLAALARDTETIRLGTLVSPVTFRSPAQLAVQVAQVDQMSGGRVELGIGVGWFQAEHDAYGIAFPAARSARLAEALAIITGLWTSSEPFDFAGKYFQITGAEPVHPVQPPMPPIILGGIGGAKSLAMAAQYATEYNVPLAPVAGAAHIWKLAAEAAAERGRTLLPSIMQTAVCGRTQAQVQARIDAGREPLKADSFQGSPAELVEQLSVYREAGAQRVYLRILDLRDLDHLALIAGDVLPHLA
jgi:alkanesulfonate monooxygenase SsuD/methylene tetrahydromethanopterin reductase-like flavin-dependent oxidoreductase (luciferase family)